MENVVRQLADVGSVKMPDDRLKVIPAEEIMSKFTRIETKLDQLAELAVKQAVIDERMVSLVEKLTIIEQTNKAVHRRLDHLEDETNENSRTVKIVNRITWLGVTIIVAGVIKMYLGV